MLVRESWASCPDRSSPAPAGYTEGSVMHIIYGAYENADSMEGRGSMVLRKLIADKTEAMHYIEAQPDPWHRQREWQHDRYGDWELRPHVVFETFGEVKSYKPEDVKTRALAKLTSEERHALGL